jgi:hypothetical protein
VAVTLPDRDTLGVRLKVGVLLTVRDAVGVTDTVPLTLREAEEEASTPEHATYTVTTVDPTGCVDSLAFKAAKPTL